MQYKIKLAFFLLINSFIFSDSIKYNSPNNHGVIGLINTPTARFFEESSSAFTAYRGDPDKKITLTMMPYDWFEASIFYTSIEGRPYPSYEWQDYKDKGFNAKFRLKKEGKLPALAIGFNDIGGTGIYSSEYIVGSYGVDNIDLHLGFGWGRLSGGSLQIDNPLGNLDKSFLIRDDNTRQGGELRWKDYFSGEQVGIFGGISYLINEDWLFKAEYDSTEIPIQEGFPIRSSDYNFSIEFLKPKNSLISLSYERGDYLGIKIVFRDNSLNYISNDYKKLERFSTTDKYQKLKEILAHNNIGIESRESYGENLNLVITEYAYSSFENLKANIKQSHIDAGLDVEKTLITYKSGGLVGYTEIKKRIKKNLPYLILIIFQD